MPRLLFRLHPRPGFMLVLFDHSTPAPLTSYLIGHTVTEARDRGWDRLSNGDLLAETERAGFDVLLTADKNPLSAVSTFCGNSGTLPLSQGENGRRCGAQERALIKYARRRLLSSAALRSA